MEKSSRSLLYTGAFRFPDGDAAAHRVRGVARLFQAEGWVVSIAGWEAPREGRAEYIFESFACHPQDEFRTRPSGLISRIAGFLLRGRRTFQWLRRTPRFDVIVAYNPPALFALALLGWAKLRRSVVVLDSTEWYEGSHLPGGRFGPVAVENSLRMWIAYRLFRHVICISRFLESHYRGANVVRIPPLTTPSVEGGPGRSPLSEGVVFVYAGEMGRKDRLWAFVRTLPRVQAVLGSPVVLKIAGPTVAAELGEAEGASLVKFCGRLPHAEVQALYREAHFSVLFREDERYAWAGFPTKAVESWAQGCPLITNAVGDLGGMVEPMTDTLVVSETELEARLPYLLKSVVETGGWPAMSARCRQKATTLFSSEALGPEFARFARRLAADCQIGA